MTMEAMSVIKALCWLEIRSFTAACFLSDYENTSGDKESSTMETLRDGQVSLVRQDWNRLCWKKAVA
jgi:hypothetical protein